MNLDRGALYENDVTMLLARYQPALEPVLALLAQHVAESDFRELKKIAAESAESWLTSTRPRRQKLKYHRTMIP